MHRCFGSSKAVHLHTSELYARDDRHKLNSESGEGGGGLGRGTRSLNKKKYSGSEKLILMQCLVLNTRTLSKETMPSWGLGV